MSRCFNIYIRNPLRTWWKARKYFKMPKISFHKVGKWFPKVVQSKFGNYVDNNLDFCPYACYNNIGKILTVYSSDVLWKDKWDSPRHERNPIIWVCLFKRIGFCITFHITYSSELGENADGSSFYWEFLLTHLYYKHNLKQALLASDGWTFESKLWRRVSHHGSSEDGSEDQYEPYQLIIPTQLFSLNKRGFKELQKND